MICKDCQSQYVNDHTCRSKQLLVCHACYDDISKMPKILSLIDEYGGIAICDYKGGEPCMWCDQFTLTLTEVLMKHIGCDEDFINSELGLDAEV